MFWALPSPFSSRCCCCSPVSLFHSFLPSLFHRSQLPGLDQLLRMSSSFVSSSLSEERPVTALWGEQQQPPPWFPFSLASPPALHPSCSAPFEANFPLHFSNLHSPCCATPGGLRVPHGTGAPHGPGRCQPYGTTTGTPPLPSPHLGLMGGAAPACRDEAVCPQAASWARAHGAACCRRTTTAWSTWSC